MSLDFNKRTTKELNVFGDTNNDTTKPEKLYNSEKGNTYDTSAKNILSAKTILPKILRVCVKELENKTDEEIINCIVGSKPDSYRIPGDQTEDNSDREGNIRFDLRYRLKINDGVSEVRLIIDIEAQQPSMKSNSIFKRGCYYLSRMISSQKGTVFKNSDYDKIQKVYSIWIIFNYTKSQEGSIVRFGFEPENLFGNYCTEEDDYDLMSLVFIRLKRIRKEDLANANKYYSYDDCENLLNLLSIIFEDSVGVDDKNAVLSNAFDLYLEDNLMKEVDSMSLAQGIYEAGIEEGRKKEREEVSKRMFNSGFSIEQIAEDLDLTEEEVKEMLEEEDEEEEE